MSRGPGKMQEAILRSLRTSQGGMTVETMRWGLFEESDGFSPGQDLPNSWNTSLARATKGLEERGFVDIVPRLLVSLEECVRHYPAKTMQAGKRALRARFLPILCDCTDDSGGITNRYGVAANEEFHLRQLPRTVVDELNFRWAGLEELLRPIYGQAPRSADDILSLICKGRRLFRRRGIEVNTSLRLAVDNVCRKNLVPDLLANDLQNFYKDFLTEEHAGSLSLKSFVRSVADVPRHRQCSLRPTTLKYLHERDRQYIESMPGFKVNESPFGLGSDMYWNDADRFTYPKGLETLFDQTVFQKFDFITLNSN